MPDKSPFINPYKDVPSIDCRRLTTDISVTDWNFVKLIRPRKGTFNVSMNLLWKAFVAELKRLDITDITKENEFESFVANLTITSRISGTTTSVGLPNGSTPIVGGVEQPSASGSNDGRTATVIRNEGANDANLAPNVPRGSVKKKSRKSTSASTSVGKDKQSVG